MASEFVQRQISRLLEEAGEAIARFDWDAVRSGAEAVLALDPGNTEGLSLLAGLWLGR